MHVVQTYIAEADGTETRTGTIGPFDTEEDADRFVQVVQPLMPLTWLLIAELTRPDDAIRNIHLPAKQ